MKHTTGSTRREFLKTAAAASTALGAPTFIPARVLGRDGAPSANEQIIIGVIGIGGRCNQLIDQVPAGGRSWPRPIAISKRATDAAKKRKANWAVYQDYREMFDTREARRRHHRHARPCPHAALHSCRAGRARCVRRKAAHRLHPRRPRAGRCTSASTSAFSKSARSSARWKSTASAASSSATASSARSNKSPP